MSQTAPHTEAELTGPFDLCDADGRLSRAAVGWSRHPLHTSNIRGHWSRKKSWNYWCVTTDKHLFSVTLADIDYLGVAFAYFLDYESGRFIEKTVTVPLARGCRLPDTVRGDVSLPGSAMELSFEEDGEATRLRVRCPDFGGAPLAADFRVERPQEHETLNVVIPWSRDRFHFTSKQNCLPASGTVTIGDDAFEFAEGDAFACLDYGRGVWRRSTFWNWASFSGLSDGRAVGVNLGGAWTDGTGHTENAIFVDGRISKLSEDVGFGYDRTDFMKPWTIRTRTSDRIDLRLAPIFEREAKTNLLVIKSEVHQLIGRYSGTIVPDDGDAIRIDGIFGWVEQHEARW
jgi:hypothetical protein